MTAVKDHSLGVGLFIVVFVHGPGVRPGHESDAGADTNASPVDAVEYR